MRNSVVAASVLVAACALPAAARAQGFSVEARAGVAVPVGELAEESPGVGAAAGPHAGAALVWSATRAVSLFAGYSAGWLGCDRCGERGLDGQVTDAGFQAGARISLPGAGLRPWVSAGVLRHELRFSDGESTLSSDPALGFQVGAGAALPLGPSLVLSPAVRYGAYTAELELGDFPDQSVEVARVVAEIGLAYRF